MLLRERDDQGDPVVPRAAGRISGEPYIPESYLYLGKAYLVNQDLDMAEQTLKLVLTKYPALDQDQTVSLLLVEVDMMREGKSLAVKSLDKVRSTVKSDEKRQELQIRSAEMYLDLKQYDAAIAMLKATPRSQKKPEQDYRVDRDLVTCYAAIDSIATALRALDAMLAQRRYAPHEQELYIDKGLLLEKNGRLDDAIAAFKLAIGPTDTATLQADTTLFAGRALFELGLLYQKRKGNFAEAAACYRMIGMRRGRDSAIAPVAAARLAALRRIDTLRFQLSLRVRDTTKRLKRLDTLYKIGELFYYSLDEPDTAAHEFLALAADSAIDSVFAPKSLCMAAYIEKRDLFDTLHADSLYTVVAEQYPESEYARKALLELDMIADTDITTRKGMASASFRNAERMYVEDNDVKGAVEAFFAVYKEYSDLDIAPQSLFVAAWLTDNELQKKKRPWRCMKKYAKSIPRRSIAPRRQSRGSGLPPTR